MLVLGPVVRESALPGGESSSGPRVDSLELLLAVAGPSNRALPPEQYHADLTRKVAAPSSGIEPALVESVVQRIVIGGDRRRGVARIDLDGDYAGTTVWVRGEGRAIELEVVLGPGVSAEGLPERLAFRLRARGLAISSVEVR